MHSRYGSPEVVHVAEVVQPKPDHSDVLVRIQATTVNRTDCAYRAAQPFIVRSFTGLWRPKRLILGTEFAGEVAAVGDAVTSFAVGDRVFGYNEGPFGCHAEYLSIPETGSLAKIPANLRCEDAAPATEGAHYALTFLDAAAVGSGHRVLVNGATGAIGSAAVQLGKARGAEVTAVCDTERMDLVRGLGADRVIDYTVEDFTAEDHAYDVVIDAVGMSSFGRCARLLKTGGVYLSSEAGRFGQNLLLAAVTPLAGRKKVVFAVPKHDQAMVRYLAELLTTGEFAPVVDRRFPLDEIVEAYRYVETGHKTGNVVITVGTAESDQERG
ncbi:NAD(P)-dependent alcohol dehydrogenase [Nocardia mangyaensis]|uniref:NAD(P)-dependent alcohol dehydrogenase n=1 Tax=Nocardia mangyaensis TaxID=2213200 RepID=A0A1J0W1H3_9NOCA|nr:NAD(P)-dependent alcohol dehydrogenase [Nocardia mangyaensis]